MSCIASLDELEPETREAIEASMAANWRCCIPLKDGTFSVCDYHEGYDEGVAAMRERLEQRA